MIENYASNLYVGCWNEICQLTNEDTGFVLDRLINPGNSFLRGILQSGDVSLLVGSQPYMLGSYSDVALDDVNGCGKIIRLVVELSTLTT